MRNCLFLLPTLTSANQLVKKDYSPIFCCCCSVTKLCPTLCSPMNWNWPGFPVLHYLLEFTQIHVHWFDDAVQPSHLQFPASPPAFSSIRDFSNESAIHIRWPKYWSFFKSAASFGGIYKNLWSYFNQCQTQEGNITIRSIPGLKYRWSF